ncbi:MAG: hypothetical protein OEY14_06500, partial [Myxococcales bacterium]|nr:hypothetical protein [Myxococcales bacterium]
MHSTPTSSPSDWTDSELLSRLLLREGSGWREFHRRYDRLLMRCIQKVMGRFRNVTSAEDDREIYCQLMVNITGNEMKRLRAYDPERGCKLSSWLGMLATHAAWDHLRCVARTPKTRAIEEALAVDCHAPSPFEAAASRERWQQVRET